LNVVDELTITEEIVQFPMDESDSFGDTVTTICLKKCTISSE
jgi:hypothetical protein